MTRTGQREGDIEWCYEAVQDVSRTFAITIAELDEPMAREVCLGYLVCRVADTVEDDGRIPPAEKAALLRRYEAVLDPTADAGVGEFLDATEEWTPDDPGADWRVVGNVDRVLATFRGLEPRVRERIRPPVRELVGGMATFVERYAGEGGLRIRTVEELEEYCWYAAGTVGELVTNLVTLSADETVARRLEGNAREFALLLQLVNVAKDVRTDYEEENNVYLPRDWLAEADVSVADIAAGASVDGVASVVERVTSRAAGYLDGAQAWLEAMPDGRGNTLAAWAVPYLLAVGTIRELERRPGDVVRRGDVKVSRAEVRAIVGRFAAGADREDVGQLRRRIRERPLHEW